jgi:hypothetical protein
MTQPMNAESLTREVTALRKKTGALAVLVIRETDMAHSTDPKLTPREVGQLLSAEIPAVVQYLSDRRGAR